MTHCKSAIGRRREKLLRSVFLLIPLGVILLAGLCLPGTVSAQSVRVVDTINGDPVTPLTWSEGSWMQGNTPIPGCTTFTGGISTGPGGASFADSVVCTAAPDHWRWTVTVGAFTLTYDFMGFPADVTVCGEIFGSIGMSGMLAQVDLVGDWMQVWNRDSGALIWSGRFSTFDPAQANFTDFGAERCGVYHMLPVPADRNTWGTIKQIYR